MTASFATPSLGRLKKRSEFLRVARAGSKWATAGLVLQVLQRRGEPHRAEPEVMPASSQPASSKNEAGEEPIRVGFTASRKVGKAVERNRAKRRLRALSRELLPASGLPGRDYVLIARQGTLKRPFAALRADLAQALTQVEKPRTRKPGRAGSRP